LTKIPQQKATLNPPPPPGRTRQEKQKSLRAVFEGAPPSRCGPFLKVSPLPRLQSETTFVDQLAIMFHTSFLL